MTEPVYMKIQAHPYAWTESSNGASWWSDLIQSWFRKVKNDGWKITRKDYPDRSAPEQNMPFGGAFNTISLNQTDSQKNWITPVPE
jgi:hypothetical protein